MQNVQSCFFFKDLRINSTVSSCPSFRDAEYLNRCIEKKKKEIVSQNFMKKKKGKLCLPCRIERRMVGGAIAHDREGYYQRLRFVPDLWGVRSFMI